MLFLAAFTLPDDYKAFAVILVMVVETLREGRNRKIRRKLEAVEKRVERTTTTRPRRSAKKPCADTQENA